MTEQLTWADVGVVAVVALGATAVVGTAGGLLVWRGRRRSLQTLVPAVAVVTMVAVVAGLLGAAAAMFLSAHDLQVVLVVAVSAGALGVALALVLGRAVMRGTEALVHAAHQLGSGQAPVIDPRPVTAELGAVAVELE
ncbi:MAG: hypothetical protein WCA29_13140, partial [Jiangellales bacterium]